MLDDQERQELVAMARSAAIREEFRRLRRESALPITARCNLDELMAFLTGMSRLCDHPLGPQPVPYPRALL